MDDQYSEKNTQKSARYYQYRDRLLKAGFSEASKKNGHFFLPASALTAFVINLDDEEYGVSVLYGFASTACMAGDENSFSEYGSDNDTCQVRNILFVIDGESETHAYDTISAFYAQYKNYTKDEILALKKERQKTFLDHFARALKPRGFKKNGTKWTKKSGDGTELIFYAQKSAFSDQYYFNVTLVKGYDPNVWNPNTILKDTRVVFGGTEIYNWQLMTEEQIGELIRYTLTNYIPEI